MADALPNYDQTKEGEVTKVKVICLGDSAVGKSNQPQQLSTYALTLFKHKETINDEEIEVDFWDTAGQERFSSMHPSYYHQAHACILVFDVTRKLTYKNLPSWYKELREYRPEIPCLCAANKIDTDYSITKKSFVFPKKHKMPFYFVSASDGTNVCFRDAIRAAVAYKRNSTDFMDEVMKELENWDLNNEEKVDSGFDSAATTESKLTNGKEEKS
ncbi:hypothetical protein LSH36_87g06041 [Paralvinella palmiformis]|uniref:Rab-like protein 2A n=1 Tax=Paralvinella palmiformis TaxID=53620 RepID=A0AAD9NDB4_9ANNE|nr:hypothetical protein LSH36_87g06041 [Paralvinella palmiformis]